MHKTEASAALADAMGTVLEHMFFITPGEKPAPPGLDRSLQVAARVRFEGAACGSLTLAVPAPAARSIAADFLAEDPGSLSTVEVEDVVRELANMVCGSALSRMGRDEVFRLESPETLLSGFATAEWPAARHSVEAGGGTLTAWLRFDASC